MCFVQDTCVVHLVRELAFMSAWSRSEILHAHASCVEHKSGASGCAMAFDTLQFMLLLARVYSNAVKPSPTSLVTLTVTARSSAEQAG